MLQIEELELYFGFQLPSDYRVFLSEHNGVSFEDWVTFPILRPYDPRNTEGHIDLLFGLAQSSESCDLRNPFYRTGYDFAKRVPEYIRVIGQSGIQHYIAMSFATEDCGSVYVWNPYLDWNDEQNGKKDYAEFQLAAPSFTQWWESLTHSVEDPFF